MYNHSKDSQSSGHKFSCLISFYIFSRYNTTQISNLSKNNIPYNQNPDRSTKELTNSKRNSIQVTSPQALPPNHLTPVQSSSQSSPKIRLTFFIMCVTHYASFTCGCEEFLRRERCPQRSSANRRINRGEAAHSSAVQTLTRVCRFLSRVIIHSREYKCPTHFAAQTA
jgi:hypothetical protein